MQAFLYCVLIFLLGVSVGCILMSGWRQGEIDRLRAQIAPFDHDGDGHIGGSRG